VNIQSLTHDVLDLHARIERAVRVLKDHLEFAAQGAELRPIKAANIPALKKKSRRQQVRPCE
jgi:hypothetical protein